MNPRVFVLIYAGGFVVIRLVSRIATRRGPRSGRRGAITESRVDLREVLSLGLFLIGGLILPLVALTPTLPNLAYRLPDWVSWTGVVIMAGGALLHWRAHADLGRNYSITVRARATQSLVTDGVYAWIRHPIYTSFWLIVLAQLLLVHHWIFGLSGLATFALLFFHRLEREEAMMSKVFGEEYRAYMRSVGGVIPRWRTPQ